MHLLGFNVRFSSIFQQLFLGDCVKTILLLMK